jgi:hypothetical protein
MVGGPINMKKTSPLLKIAITPYWRLWSLSHITTESDNKVVTHKIHMVIVGGGDLHLGF